MYIILVKYGLNNIDVVWSFQKVSLIMTFFSFIYWRILEWDYFVSLRRGTSFGFLFIYLFFLILKLGGWLFKNDSCDSSVIVFKELSKNLRAKPMANLTFYAGM